jgi:peptidoglycan/LPS O-acetylase OafA/YrhL
MTTDSNPDLRKGFTHNNFDLIRLVAASQVMVLHLFVRIVGYSGPLVFAINSIPGVPIFFFVSGFLISASWERDPDLRRFFRNRFLRIFPGYWAAFLLSVAGILLFYRNLDLAHNASKFALWMLCQLAMIPDWNPGFLRGYGTGVANGSLWTIPVELSFYVSIPILYWLFGKTRSPTHILLGVIVLSFAVAAACVTPVFAISAQTAKFLLLTPLPWIGIFAIGILAQRNFEWLLPRVAGRFFIFVAIYAVIVIVSWKLTSFRLDGLNWLTGLVGFPVLCALVLSSGYTDRSLAERLLHRNDISYGVYLFHEPLANMMLANGISGMMCLALVSTLSVPLALMSWFFIERPSLSLKVKPLYGHE